jgi:mannose-6-phosphate isomerase-like protein (cupin superfamily)
MVDLSGGMMPSHASQEYLRTDRIDHAVMSGEIDMEMDETVVPLKAGAVLVHRRTIPHWVNHGTAPCGLAWVLISSDGNPAAG